MRLGAAVAVAAALARLCAGFAPSAVRRPRLPSRRAAAAGDAPSLEAVLGRLSAFGRARFITMRPDKSCIFEAACELGDMSVSTKEMPSGATLLTVASTDKSLEFHVDVGRAQACALSVSPKTGGALARLLDEAGDAICTIVLSDPPAPGLFDEIRAELQPGDAASFALRRV